MNGANTSQYSWLSIAVATELPWCAANISVQAVVGPCVSNCVNSTLITEPGLVTKSGQNVSV